MKFFSCPDGHKWYRCAHPELANKPLGVALMALGALQVAIGLAIIFR